MREIKFRGKRVDNGEWWVGDLISDCEAGSLKVRKTYVHNRISGVPNFNGDCLGSIITMVEVIPETICQFTGFQDKNHIDIYSKDRLIVRSEDEEIGFVDWDDAELRYIIQFDTYQLEMGNFYGWELEVVGNIYDTN